MIMNSIMAIGHAFVPDADDTDERRCTGSMDSTTEQKKQDQISDREQEQSCKHEHQYIEHKRDQNQMSSLWNAGMDFITSITEQLTLDDEILALTTNSIEDVDAKKRYALLPWEELCEETVS
jgi:hypothetical protein